MKNKKIEGLTAEYVEVTRAMSDPNAGVITRYLDLTPAMATEWLKLNTHNRGLNDDRVAAHVDAILGDRWQVTHQGAAFSVSKVLLDGQHRLVACARADRTIRIAVTTGLSDSVQLVMDRGAIRTVAQNVGLSGQKNAKQVTAWANMARFCVTNTQSRYFDEGEVLDLYQELPSAIEFAVSCGKGAVTRGPVGAVVLLGYNKDPAQTEEFFAAFLAGEGLRKGSAVLAANKFYFQGLTRVKVSRTDIRLKLLRCLQGHIKGDNIDPAHVYATQSSIDFFAESHKPESIFGRLLKERSVRKHGTGG